MAAVIQRNETASANLRSDLIIESVDGTPAPRKTNFAAYLYISISTYLYQLALGTLTNKRRPLAFAGFNFTADPATDRGTHIAHGFETGDGPFLVTNTGGALPGGLLVATQYWLVNPAAGDTGGDDFKFATSLANAYAGVTVDITSAGTGTQTLNPVVGQVSRGIDGQWNYQLDPAEVTLAGAEIGIAILGHPTYQAYTSVNYVATGASAWSETMEGGLSYGDGMRLMMRTDVAFIERFPDGSYNVYKLDGTLSHHGKITTGGRIVHVVDDAAP